MSEGEPTLAETLRPADVTLPQDWAALRSWLRAKGMRLDDSARRQFASGVANLNYLIGVDGTAVVLRRPPAGVLAEGASDMAREARVLRTLPDAYPLAPRALAYCDDPSVLGAPFQLIEYRPGLGVGGTLPSAWAGRTDIVPTLVDHLVAAMAELHRVDPDRAGLAGLGRPEGFLKRQVGGWTRRADAAYGGDVPAAGRRVLAWLESLVPSGESGASLLHCDLKLDNMLFDPQTQVPIAVVDWDMATTGDPLFDLGVLLAYWVEDDDPDEVKSLGQVPSLVAGAPTRSEVAARYFSAAGREPQDLTFHLALGRVRLAIAWRQLFVLHERGTLPDPKYAAFAGIADAMLAWTADTLT